MHLVKLTASEFRDMAGLIYKRTGIHLPECKLTLLSNRLRRRLKALELSTFREYYDLLRNPKACEEELPHFLSAVTTNETYFFRNENLWKFVRKTWIPELMARKGKGNRSIRVWSAAGSSGEEAYTTAICLLAELADIKKWRVEVIGSDISVRMLERAEAGEYNEYAIAKVPKPLLLKWFEQRDGVYAVRPAVRALVSFRAHNLREPFPESGFDLVFLRNVLMYFDTAMKCRVLRNVAAATRPGGYLVIGDVDPVRNTPELSEALNLDYCGPNMYRKPEPVLATAGSSKGS